MKNNTVWRDRSGAPIQAHGGCLLFHEGTYYFYGENKAGLTVGERVDFIGFSCYSSTNLVEWTNEGLILAAVDEPEHPLSPAMVCERPAVVYNEATSQFVLWFHHDDAAYKRAEVGLAVSNSPTGPFRFCGCCQPNGRESRDMNLFVDRDGKGYLLSSADWNSTLLIHELTPDYLGFTGAFRAVFAEQYREAPAVLEQDGTYYMVSSGCTGWAPNSMLYATAPHMLGNWRLIDDPCSGPDARKTFYGQSADTICICGQWYLLLDHWDVDDLGSSRYSLLPVKLDGRWMEILWTDDSPALGL